MTREEFWHIIDQSRAAVTSEGSIATQARLIRENLSDLDRQGLIDFEFHFRNCHRSKPDDWLKSAAFVLSGLANNDNVTNDDFESFRRWLVSRGRKAHDKALVDPDTLILELPNQLESPTPDNPVWFSLDGSELVDLYPSVFEAKFNESLPIDTRPARESRWERIRWSQGDLDSFFPALAYAAALHPRYTSTFDDCHLLLNWVADNRHWRMIGGNRLIVSHGHIVTVRNHPERSIEVRHWKLPGEIKFAARTEDEAISLLRSLSA